jgi:hypothetical protein
LGTVPGIVPNPARFPTGCKFHPRCHRTRQLASQAPENDTVEIVSGGERFRVLRRCQNDEPTVRELSPKHWAQCHQLPGYDSAPQTVPLVAAKRTVVPHVVVPEGTPIVTAGAGATEVIS